MQGNRGKGRNRLIAPRSHSSAFALFPPPPPLPVRPSRAPVPSCAADPGRPTALDEKDGGLGRKSGSWSKRLYHFLFFFPFAILKEHFRMWRRRALCCACGPLGCFSFMRRWCAQMTDMKRKSCGAEHATDNTQKSTKKKKTRSTAVFLPLAFTTLPSPAHCPGRSPLARSCAS